MNLYYNLYDIILLLPEFFFFIIILFLLIFGVFYSNINIYKYIIITKTLIVLILISFFFYICLLLNSFFFGFNSIFAFFFLNDSLTIFLKIYLILLAFFFLFFSYNFFFFFEIFYFEFIILFIISCFSLILILMCFDFIVLYLAIELQSLCFYVLTAFNKNSNKSVEAGLKYFILGSFSSCLLLLGIAIIYGITGCTNFKDLSDLLTFSLNSSVLNNFFFLGFIFIIIGLFFKLAVAPFHLWLPDIFYGASRLVVTIFALIPKFVILFLIYKFYLIFFIKISFDFEYFFIFFIIFCWLIGSLGAISTRNINKILAYSSINHMGFFLLPIILNDLISFFLYIVIYTTLILNIFIILFCLRK